MRPTVFLTAALVAASPATGPALAQDSGGGFFEDLGRETDRLLGELMRELGPMLRDIERELGKLDQYEAPEVLPNGDILIRRKRRLETPPAPDRPSPQEPRQRDGHAIPEETET